MAIIEINGWRFSLLPTGDLLPELRGAGGGDAPAPATPSAEEKALLQVQTQAAQEQLAIARRQQKEQDALMPLLLAQYGITRVEDVTAADPRVATLQAERAKLVADPGTAQILGGTPVGEPFPSWQYDVRDPGYARAKAEWERTHGGSARSPQAQANAQRIAEIDKELAGLEKGGKKARYEQGPEWAKRKEIEGLQLERSLKALKGELPVTATLAKELELGKRTLHEKLSRQLGPGYETTTAGIQAMAEYDRMATSLKEAEQRDQLTTAEALSIQRQGSREGATQNLYSTTAQPAVTTASLLGTSISGAAAPLSYYGQLRNASLTARQMAGQETAGYVGAGVGAVGIGVAAAIAI